jgi:hypothetical protein
MHRDCRTILCPSHDNEQSDQHSDRDVDRFSEMVKEARKEFLLQEEGRENRTYPKDLREQ